MSTAFDVVPFSFVAVNGGNGFPSGAVCFACRNVSMLKLDGSVEDCPNATFARKSINVEKVDLIRKAVVTVDPVIYTSIQLLQTRFTVTYLKKRRSRRLRFLLQSCLFIFLRWV